MSKKSRSTRHSIDLKRLCLIVAMVNGLTLVQSALAEHATFQGVGVPDGAAFSSILGLSGNGSVAVGFTSEPTALAGFRWTKGTGRVPLGYLNDSKPISIARAASTDGSVIVGLGDSALGNEAFRWTDDGTMIGLGALSTSFFQSDAYSVSGDGSIIVGRSYAHSAYEAYRWTESTGMVGLGTLDNEQFSTSTANGISTDGNVIVGFSSSEKGTEAFRWTESEGMIPLGDLPGGSVVSRATATSSDGSVIVGRGRTDAASEAFRWTDSEGMTALGLLPGDVFSEPTGLSSDGSIIVGYKSSIGQFEPDGAFIWTERDGTRLIQDVLSNEYGVDLSGWQLSAATSISGDGKTITGYGRNPQGLDEGWVAIIPEPTSAAIWALGTLMLVRRHRISRSSRNH